MCEKNPQIVLIGVISFREDLFLFFQVVLFSKCVQKNEKCLFSALNILTISSKLHLADVNKTVLI